jgi:hypothetical protein
MKNPYKLNRGGTYHKVLGDISSDDWHYLNSINPFRGWQDLTIGTLIHALVTELKALNITSYYDDPNNRRKFEEVLRRVTFSRAD